jgi:ATP-dependent helicase/nuclease subunit A
MSDSRRTDLESRLSIRQDLLTNILVEAGAGSGKTQMLAERMAAGVAGGVYRIDQMAAVTFTRKAASELRGRFHLALEDRLTETAPRDGDASEAEVRLRYALANLERFFAGTIHSFCARLLRERPVESGVAPGFTELDEVQDLELRKRAWRDFITSARSAGDPLMLELLDTGVKPPDLDDAFRVICENEDVVFPSGEGTCPDSKPAWKALERFWAVLQKHLPETIDADTTCKIQQAARQFQGQLRVWRKRADRADVVATMLNTWNIGSRIVQSRWGSTSAEKKTLKDVIEPVHEKFVAETVAPYMAQWRQYVYRLSIELLTTARDRAANERRRLNALNYGDLLNLTAKVLRENAQVRRALQGKYRFLFVDEFQDTDPVQAEILFLLAADEESKERVTSSTPVPRCSRPGSGIADLESRQAGIDWRSVRLHAGSLFVVGDPKQSIYRFRRADIEIYNIVRDRFSDPDVGRVLPLTMNFRSVPSLCQWANRVFEKQFPKEATPQSPRFAPLDPKEDIPSSSRAQQSVGGVFTLSHACEQKEVIAEDAEKIARYIRAEVDAQRRGFSDFLILTRKKKDRLAPYAHALEALDIPIEVSGAGAFGESVEIEALTALLRSLSDPEDSLSLVAVLRGPLFGLSDPELFAFKQAGGWFSVFHGLDDDGFESSGPGTSGSDQNEVGSEALTDSGSPIPDPVSKALVALRRYFRWTRILPAGGALDLILESTGYLALAATTPGGVEAADLLHAIDRVRQVVEEGGSLADAADALEADAEASNEVESLPLEPGRSDVVRLMNLHKAKGLEAHVVFLADPCGGFKPRVDVHIARTGAVSHGWFPLVRRSEKSYASTTLGEHVDWPMHETTEQAFVDAEVDRLLYVAATRAKQMLVVSRWTENKGTPAWGVLNAFLDDAKELSVPSSTSFRSSNVAAADATTRAHAVAAIEGSHERARQPSWSISSVTAEARHIARMTRAVEPSAPDDVTKVVVPDTASHRADAGMAWGTLIHGLLEHAMRHASATREDLRRLAMWLTVEEPQLRVVIEEALDTVQHVTLASFWRDASVTDRFEEAPFCLSEADNQLSRGVVDLIFHSADGWRIVDYKTEQSADSHSHRAQLDAYRTALVKLGCQVADATVVSARVKPSGFSHDE